MLLFESRLRRKQTHIANILSQRELIIVRQQKLIDALSSRLVDHGYGLDVDTGGSGNYTDFDSLNDSDSAVVLEDIDSDCNSSFIGHRRKANGGSGIDVTIVRSISDAIDTNLNKYSVNNGRRSNCFLRRPEVLGKIININRPWAHT